MDLKTCSWRQVVAALRRCGNVDVLERDEHIAVGKIPHIFTLRKLDPVPPEVQEKILRKLGISKVDYVSFLEDPPLAN